MTDWTRTERTLVTVEYEIPVNEPWGACHNQVTKAIDLAQHEYFELYGRWPSDDAIRVHVTDDAIRVVFEKKEKN